MAGFFVLFMCGGMCYGIWRLLHLPSKPIEHFVCLVYRSTYPPHPEDWAITHHIRVFRGLFWIIFGINALLVFVFCAGVIAVLGTSFTH
jgi:hypothetical protein